MSLRSRRGDVVGVCAVEPRERRGLGSLLCRPVLPGTDPALDDGECVVCPISEIGRDDARVVDDAGDESHSEGFVGVDNASGEREVEGCPLPDDAGKSDGPTPRAEQTEADAGFAEGGLGGRHSEVTGECEFDASAAGRPVDAGDDDRIALLEHARDALTLAGERFGVVECGDGVEVRPRTETRAGAVEVDDRFVGVDDSRLERVEVGRAKRVPTGGAVERDDSDVVFGRRSNHILRCRPLSKGLWLCRR